MAAELCIGALEAGGTKMVLAVGMPNGEILERELIPTAEPARIVPKIITWFADRRIDALGVGAFGPTGVNPELPSYGRVLSTPKQGWVNYDFLGVLLANLKVPIGYDTDVNAACLGEVSFGAARGLKNIVYLTIGTGIGAGVLLDGKLLHGMLHPEAGHIPTGREKNDPLMESACKYHTFCLEGLAAGPSIEKRWGLPATELEDKTEVWELEATYLAKALATYVLCYSPQRIILGGGVMKQIQLFPLIRQKLTDILNGYITTPEFDAMDSYVVASGCGGDQGILGALTLGVQALG